MKISLINKTIVSGEIGSNSCVIKTKAKTNPLLTLPILHNINRIKN